ncbi:hypothetical protein QAD02_018036 [Eretmocerus hayati]|uniref:Uncharacterized protein n=1 Tax=Eretmocerus hayati TaxID=131215 RepID=A0ACC2PG19_9HYME|nr:hypothetical protein QAD02_018036 [Eretmocerus hayati]
MKEILNYLSSHSNEINKTIDLSRPWKLNKCTPLDLALRFGHFKHAALIFNNGTDPNIINEDRETPLEFAFSHKVPHDGSLGSDCEKFFHTAVRSMRNFKPSHFHIACSLGIFAVINFVFDSVADEQFKLNLLNCVNDANQSPLHVFLMKNRLGSTAKEIIQLLLDNGADVGARDYQLQTPLHYAQTLEPDALQLLIDHGSDVNA